jgi:hypothetical protein
MTPSTAILTQSYRHSHIEAVSGTLEIRAVFPDGDVKIDLLKKLSA